MDSMRGYLSGGNLDADAGVEAPPVIGVDERRMQVRAYNFWASLLGDRAYPAVEDLDMDALDDFGPHAVLLDFTAGIENPGLAFLGDQLREESAISDDVHYINQIPGRSLLSRLTDHYLQIIANRAPIGFEAEFVNDRGITIMYRGILLPFSSDDDTIDFILGVINWKEAMPADQAAELELSVEQALRSSPPLTAPVPVWADGPDSEHLDDEPEPGFSGFADSATSPTDAFTSANVPEPSVESEADESILLLDETAELADWLAAARDTAERAIAADSRSRTALYHAVGQAWDFAVAAEDQPDAFAELVEDAGLTIQDRAPMTPVVKLVFGANYDKTRLAEYACVLGHAREQGLARGALSAYLESYPGGLKGLVRNERARRKPAGKPAGFAANVAAQIENLQRAHPVAVIEHDAGDAEFVVIIGRRMEGGHLGLVATAACDDATFAKLASKAEMLARQ